jgi:hypothetical protein
LNKLTSWVIIAHPWMVWTVELRIRWSWLLDKRWITLKIRIGTEILGEIEGQTRDLRRALLLESQRAPMKGQGDAALKGILLLISRRQDSRPLLHALRLMNLPLEKGLMDVAHVVCRGDIAFAKAPTPLLFLGMIAVGAMENISLVVHKQLPRIGNALQPARVLRVW